MLQRLTSKLVKHGSRLLSDLLDKLEGIADSVIKGTTVSSPIILRETDATIQGTLEGVVEPANRGLIEMVGPSKVTGGTLVATGVCRAITTTGDGARIDDVRVRGVITDEGEPAYALVLQDVTNIDASRIDVEKFTGAVFINRGSNITVRDIRARSLVYHTRLEAGGYGVLLSAGQGELKNVLIDGVYLSADASKGDKGRHVFYLAGAVAGYPYRIHDVVLRNLRGEYNNLRNRHMYYGVIRTSQRVLIDGFHFTGGNAGISLVDTEGSISDIEICNGYMQTVISPEVTPGSYAINTASSDPSDYSSLSKINVHDVTLEGMDGTSGDPDKPGFVALHIGCRNSRYNNITMFTFNNSRPILMDRSLDITISNVEDLSSGAGDQPLIWMNQRVENLTLSGIRTRRSKIYDASNMKTNGVNVSVDFARSAIVRCVNGAFSAVQDDYGMVQRMRGIGGASVGEFRVTLPLHVTTRAAESAVVECRGDSPYIMQSYSYEEASRELVIIAFTTNGNRADLAQSTFDCKITFSC